MPPTQPQHFSVLIRKAMLKMARIVVAIAVALLAILFLSWERNVARADLGEEIVEIGPNLLAFSVAWGDWDGDGDLDLAVGGIGFIEIYENEQNSLSIDLSNNLGWRSFEVNSVHSLAFGDWDGDGDLDLAAGTSTSSMVFENVDGTMILDTANNVGWQVPSDSPTSVAWGDWDNDGDLDLALGNSGTEGSWATNQVYENISGTLQLDSLNQIGWESPDATNTTSLAWGDWDNDGDLDLAVGNSSTEESEMFNQVYENIGGDLILDRARNLGWTAPTAFRTQSIAWGDVDGDGDLDLAIGNSETSYIYENTGGDLSFNLSQGLGWELLSGKETESIAFGDWDGDGDLDLALGKAFGVHQVLENDADKFQLDIANGMGWTFESDDFLVTSVAWADWDSDGDLDLAMANWGGEGISLVHQNNGGHLLYDYETPLPATPEAESIEEMPNWEEAQTLAWGDWDGDGDLDLAVGKLGPLVVYQNEAGILTFDPENGVGWKSEDIKNTTAVAWGDWDNDGDLDLAVGNNKDADQEIDGFDSSVQFNQVYEYESGTLLLDPLNQFGWQSSEVQNTTSVAWADWDGDGDLDLSVGNHPGPIELYENVGGTLQQNPMDEIAPDVQNTTSIAWGDWDNDGDLDLAVGNRYEPNRVYENDNKVLRLDPTQDYGWEASSLFHTRSVVWGDWDDDGDLDLAVGNYGVDRAQVYENEQGTLNLSPSLGLGWQRLRHAFDVDSVSWGDWDGDGDLDLLVGNEGFDEFNQNGLYINTGGDFRLSWPLSEVFTDLDATVFYSKRFYAAWGDVDQDGDLDFAMVDDLGGTYLIENKRLGMAYLPNDPSGGVLQLPVATNPAFFFSSSEYVEASQIPIRFTIRDDDSTNISAVRGYYSLNGGGDWRPAIATTDTITSNLAISATHVYTWDTFASGFFGASDNVVFRLDIVDMTGPYLYPKTTIYSTPFRVRGTQVRVTSQDLPIPSEGNAITTTGVVSAVVYQLLREQSRGAEPIGGFDRPYRTDPQGYLQGRGDIQPGDVLYALLPTATEGITFTHYLSDSAQLYITSAEPITTGLIGYTVTQAGVQTLTVSSAHPLLLFDLNVSLEWDARSDPQFLSQLELDLQRTSEFLYDWTNGQAALGTITLYHDRDFWNDAHVRIYATNEMRPHAAQGGVVTQVITDPVKSALVYGPGQVHMGAVWNRFGQATSNLSEDWPRTLAHELGHYLFFLDDNYLGIVTTTEESGITQEIGMLTLLEDELECPGAMSDPYADDQSEFHPDAGWEKCQQTLSNYYTQRSDWATITTFYPWLHAPAPQAGISQTNPGPALLPLAVTQLITGGKSITFSLPLEIPIFYLVGGNGQRYVPETGTRAILFTRAGGERLIDLGRANQDRVLARGARVGDRLCIYESARSRFGCETVRAGDEQLRMVTLDNWTPDLQISPVTSTTLKITLINTTSIDSPIYARLYPLNGSASTVVTLTAVLTSANHYTGTLVASEGVLDGYIHLWVDEDEVKFPRREMVTDYAIGGNPTHKKSGSGRSRGNPTHKKSGSAPVLSSDGQALLFGVELDTLPPDVFYLLQSATQLPAAPTWATQVGRAYWLLASPTATDDLEQTSLAFNYLSNEVPENAEEYLQVYQWQENTKFWKPMQSIQDGDHNFVAAQVTEPGLYALMYSVELRLEAAGWNLFGYPVQGTHRVTEALSYLRDSNNYGGGFTVYGYDAKAPDPHARWQIYRSEFTGTMSVLNTLTHLKFGHGYWITVTQPITILLNDRLPTQNVMGSDGASTVDNSSAFVMPQTIAPPVTVYGEITATERALTALMGTSSISITAEVEVDNVTHLCGTGKVSPTQEGDWLYLILFTVGRDITGQSSPCDVDWHLMQFSLHIGGERYNLAQQGEVVSGFMPFNKWNLKLEE